MTTRAAVLLSAAALTCCAAAPPRPCFAPQVSPYEVVPVNSRPTAYIVRYDPPAIYELWWQEMAECSGRLHPALAYDSMRFYIVGPDSTFLSTDTLHHTLSVYALQDFHWPGNILVAAPFVMRGDIIRHEMLHAITSPTRYQGHPDSVFRGRCDSLVYHAGGP